MLAKWNKPSARAGLLGALVAALVAAAGDEKARPEVGFVSLFNGKDLAGWKAEHTDKFSVRDGVIFLGGGLGWLRSEKEYADFELRLEFRILKPGSDSGVFVRATAQSVPAPPHWPTKAYQVQLADGPTQCVVYAHGAPKPKLVRDEKAVEKARKPVGQWQTLALKVAAQRLEVILNGTLAATTDDLQAPRGHLGLQGEEGVFEFRNIRIKESTAK